LNVPLVAPFNLKEYYSKTELVWISIYLTAVMALTVDFYNGVSTASEKCASPPP